MILRDDLKYYGKVATRPAFYVAGQIELTTRCFANCAFCAKESKQKRWPDPLSLETAKLIVEELFTNPWFESLTFTGGDPLAWPYLHEFLLWLQELHCPDKLHLNTTLQGPISPSAWKGAVAGVRVSIDGVIPSIIKETRGVAYDIDIIVDKMWALHDAGIEVQTNTCVSRHNIHHLAAIVRYLSERAPFIRKAMFLPVLGDNGELLEEWDREVWTLREQKAPFQTSFAEDPSYLRREIDHGDLDGVRCWASKLGFHMKPNGSVYRCCLTGGEAVEADDRYYVGQYRTAGDMQRIYDHVVAAFLYQTPTCRSICQYKQSALNLVGERASVNRLKLP